MPYVWVLRAVFGGEVVTEEEWLTCHDPIRMQSFLQIWTRGERKAWLSAVACSRSIWQSLSDERIKNAMEVAERYADGHASENEWRVAKGVAQCVMIDPATSSEEETASAADWAEKFGTVVMAVEGVIQCYFIRDIFGNPFRPVTLSPRWLSETVVALATGIYQERAFDRMPILADALEEVGCDHADILSHCRGEGPHVRGCWVVDLILGKQ